MISPRGSADRGSGTPGLTSGSPGDGPTGCPARTRTPSTAVPDAADNPTRQPYSAPAERERRGTKMPPILRIFPRSALYFAAKPGARWPQPTWTPGFRDAVAEADIDRGTDDDADRSSARDRCEDAPRGVVLNRRGRADRAEPAVRRSEIGALALRMVLRRPARAATRGPRAHHPDRRDSRGHGNSQLGTGHRGSHPEQRSPPITCAASRVLW